MPRTSTKQEEIYEFLRRFTEENGYAPSVREICAAVGLRSTASVHYHLNELKKQGRIVMEQNKNRTLTVTASRGAWGRVPLVGVVTAGLPILAVENIENYVPWDGEEGCFALRVRGESMIGAGILDGDIVIVRQQRSADKGDIVVALIGDEATVKRLDIRENGVWLMPENEAFEPIDGREAVVLGKVKGLLREY